MGSSNFLFDFNLHKNISSVYYSYLIEKIVHNYMNAGIPI